MNQDTPESGSTGIPVRQPTAPPVLIIPAANFEHPVRPAPAPHRRRIVLPLVLFVLTCISTYFSGGLEYAIGVMAILGAHEMGHYLQTLRYRVPASLPFFIPMPASPLGTMGAVIVQQAGVADRKSLFDIAISGPLAGLVIALPLTYWGIQTAVVEPVPLDQPVTMFGDPLLIQWMVRWIHGPIPPGSEVHANPLLFAGWVGILITALNLIPIGQLDGGHILYALLRRKANFVMRLVFIGALTMVIYGGMYVDPSYYAWSMMLVLLTLMGTRHPPTADDFVPLGWGRKLLGWATLLFIIIGFTPTPIYEKTYSSPQVSPVAIEADFE